MSVAAVAGPTPGMVSNRRAVSPSNSALQVFLGGRDLLLIKVVLRDEQLHLEGDLRLQFGRRHRLGCQLLQLCRLRRANRPCSITWALDLGQGVKPQPRHRLRCWGLAQYGQRAHAGRVVPGLAQLGEANVHQALDPLAGLGLLAHQAHGEPRRLLEFCSHQGV